MEPSKRLQVSVGQSSTKGRKPLNQDFCGEYQPDNFLLESKGITVAMADGISSSNVSQLASETAVTHFLDDYFSSSQAWSIKGSAKRSLANVNARLYSRTMRSEYRYNKDKGFVCTLSVVIIHGESAYIFHVGDTRVYQLHDQGLEQLTNDHRIWHGSEQSYLSRALGMNAQCPFDERTVQLAEGDHLIICTDGVYEFTSQEEMLTLLKRYSNDLNAAAQAIVDRAYEQGSDDNLSIQIIRIETLPELVDSVIRKQVESLPLPPPFLPRMEFDGYRILRELYASARSHVYLALDLETEQKVVIKKPATDLSDSPEYLERLLMEEWVARRINNAHVLKAAKAHRNRNYIYTVFEFIEGQTLAQWALDHPKPPLTVVRSLIEQVAKGLHAFHRLEMLHQDLRPENVMIDANGTVKIIDFGSVFMAGAPFDETQTVQTYLMGTALYSAPEYFLGEQGSVRSELFSLGVLTYFLISGRYPYATDVAKAKTRAAQKKLKYQSVLDEERETPVWIDVALRKALQPFPQARYEGLFEFIHDLRRPGQAFLNQQRPPLMERNPLRFWQSLCLGLLLIILYLTSLL